MLEESGKEEVRCGVRESRGRMEVKEVVVCRSERRGVCW